MSSTYKIKKGDTLDKIARKLLGSEVNADKILLSNPELSDILNTGNEIVVPELPDAPKDKLSPSVSNSNSEVSLLIEGARFRFWDTITINAAIDSIDLIEFTAPFEIENTEFRKIFKPFEFQDVTVFVGSELLFKGTLINLKPEISDNKKTIIVSCYSKVGVLNDCTPSASSFPIEFNNIGLSDIAKNIVAPFGIDVEFLANQGPVFERVACDADRNILDFLTELANQRNLIISNSKDGKLVFLSGTESGNPIATLIQGASPLVSITPFFSQQQYYSHITGIEPVVTGTKGSQFTVKNARLKGAIRPYTFKANDTLGGNVKDAVNAKASRMFGDAISYEIVVSTWRDSKGNLWEVNKNILIQAPDAMIYSKYEFTIRSVRFERDENLERAILNVVLVGSFSGKIPKGMPWD